MNTSFNARYFTSLQHFCSEYLILPFDPEVAMLSVTLHINFVQTMSLYKNIRCSQVRHFLVLQIQRSELFHPFDFRVDAFRSPAIEYVCRYKILVLIALIVFLLEHGHMQTETPHTMTQNDATDHGIRASVSHDNNDE